MKKALVFIFSLMCSAVSLAGLTDKMNAVETSRKSCVLGQLDAKLMTFVERLAAFGKSIPQEKVYLHMDNNSYFLGDTIWFAAYTRQTSDDKPSKVSGVLYVELYNQEGYLMERKLIDIRGGRGFGNFELKRDFFGGFYELRAYTRWQLNWGLFEHPHSHVSKGWYLNKELEQRHYRDYDKIYSRVFPVYDAPKKGGEYFANMTGRPKRRYFKSDPDNYDFTLSLYPEGGNLVKGLPCRVAYEAVWDDGEELKLKDRPSRGVIEVVADDDLERTIQFETDKGKKVSAKLPKPLKEGAALALTQTDDTWQLKVHLTESLAKDSFAVTVMHEGNLQKVYALVSQVQTIDIPRKDLPEGVNQVTLFDVTGSVVADRLFFNTHPDFEERNKPNVSVSLLEDEGDMAKQVGPEEAYFGPYQRIRLGVQSKPNAVLSVAVRDVAHLDHPYDNATLLSEMLLSSEVKGFIANPEQYFERDDSAHRQALDLLLMIQGWRRYDWHNMAVPGAWDITQMAEPRPTVSGTIYETPDWYYYNFTSFDYCAMDMSTGWYNPNNQTTLIYDTPPPSSPIVVVDMNADGRADLSENTDYSGRMKTRMHLYNTMSAFEPNQDGDIKREKNVTVHAELVSTDGKDVRVQNVFSKDGTFRFVLPGYYDDAILFLSASDTTKWAKKKSKKAKQHYWVQMVTDEEDVPVGHSRRFRTKSPEFIIRVDFPYPRFVKPYNYYQKSLLASADKLEGEKLLADGTKQMRQVNIGAKRGGQKQFNDSLPTFYVDAYQAYNDALDGGMYYPSPELIVRNYLGDYGHDFPYQQIGELRLDPFKPLIHGNIQTRYGYDLTRRSVEDLVTAEDSIYMRGNLASFLPYNEFAQSGRNIAPQVSVNYHVLSHLDKYVIYTDYEPRMEGSMRYYGGDIPNTQIAIYPYQDNGRRVVYRDRRYVLKGYSYADDFYHPNYRNRKMGEKPKDYRRTLYWNPNLKLDQNGRANIQLYNNGKNGQISISAEGMMADGQILGN